MGKLDGKVAIITGGAGGIGSGMAKAMVKEGAIVTIVDLNEETGKAMEKELQQYSPESMFMQVNLMDRNKLGNIVETVVKKYGKQCTCFKTKAIHGNYTRRYRSFFRYRFLSDILFNASSIPLFKRNQR